MNQLISQITQPTTHSIISNILAAKHTYFICKILSNLVKIFPFIYLARLIRFIKYDICLFNLVRNTVESIQLREINEKDLSE